jgi:Galactose oxidase, central domain/Kelch motif
MGKHLVLALIIFFVARTAHAETLDTSWRITGSMNNARRRHTATLLPDGNVLVAGGTKGLSNLSNGSDTAEIYQPVTATWRFTSNLRSGRVSHTATLLGNGKVLVAGGVNESGTVTNTAELYDPVTQTWSNTGGLHWPRASHTATLLPNGKVLLTGGIDSPSDVLQTAEVYDPETGAWTATGEMHTPRWLHTATLLPTGEVLVAGGVKSGVPPASFLYTAELYDPVTQTWRTTSDTNSSFVSASALLLPNGKVLVSQGEKLQSELYDPPRRTWTPTGKVLADRVEGYTTTLLSNGKALLAGGYNYDFPVSRSVGTEIYDSASGMWSSSGKMNTGRSAHTATLLSNSMVLVAGGAEEGSTAPVSSAELFQPDGSDAIGIEFQPAAVQARASFFAAFSGADVNPETWFDVRFRSTDSTTDDVALNWQRGAVSLHQLGAGTVAGTYTITGIRKHTNQDDHRSDFTSVSVGLTVLLP